jgi:YhcH/YjgK/YiaL family protein
MILDSLSNWGRYRSLNPRFAAAFEFLSNPKSLELEPVERGSQSSLRISIDDENVFALVQRYTPKDKKDAFWEAHRKYVDVQVMVHGEEVMLWAPLASMTVVKPYDGAKDFTQLSPKPMEDANVAVRVSALNFAIFFPHDAHAPGLATGVSRREVKKIVVKVAV